MGRPIVIVLMLVIALTLFLAARGVGRQKLAKGVAEKKKDDPSTGSG